MAESPFPDLNFEELEMLRSVDPELERERFDTNIRPPAPLGISPRFDFSKGDLALTAGDRVLFVRDYEALDQWVNQTLLTERFESPLLSDDIGMEMREKHLGEIITYARLVEMAASVSPALKVHDRISKVFVQRVFSVGQTVYMLVKYVVDDDEERVLLATV